MWEGIRWTDFLGNSICKWALEKNKRAKWVTCAKEVNASSKSVC